MLHRFEFSSPSNNIFCGRSIKSRLIRIQLAYSGGAAGGYPAETSAKRPTNRFADEFSDNPALIYRHPSQG